MKVSELIEELQAKQSRLNGWDMEVRVDANPILDIKVGNGQLIIHSNYSPKPKEEEEEA